MPTALVTRLGRGVTDMSCLRHWLRGWDGVLPICHAYGIGYAVGTGCYRYTMPTALVTRLGRGVTDMPCLRHWLRGWDARLTIKDIKQHQSRRDGTSVGKDINQYLIP